MSTSSTSISDTRTFFVLGEPAGEPRARARGMLIGGKARARVYRDTSTDGWKGAVADVAQREAPSAPIDAPVEVTLVFHMPRPKSKRRQRWHTAKPDADNLAKSVLDTMTRCGWWVDDSRVSVLIVRKMLAPDGSDAGCYVSVQVLP